MNTLPGVQEWTPTQIEEKESAVTNGASRTIATVIRGALPGDYQIAVTDGDTSEGEWSYGLAAECHLLSQLNFPNKLKPFLDTLLASAAGVGSRAFTATNLEIGQKSRSGRDACSDNSMEKWVSRQKRALDEWQTIKGFELVQWFDGEYDFELNRRKPTRYVIALNRSVVRCVEIAKTKFYWGKGDDARGRRNRALREAARQTLLELPECPNLALKPKKTLSEEQKFDRRHHAVLTYMEKNRDALKAVGFDPVVYFRFLLTELDKIASNPAGMAGKLLTPEADEPDHKSSVWTRIKTGDIADDIERNASAIDRKADLLEETNFDSVEYAFEATRDLEKEIQKPKYFRDGEFVESDQRFGNNTAPETAEVLNNSESDNHFKHQGDIFDALGESPINTGDFEHTDKLSTKGTFLSGSEPETAEMLNTSEPDFTDWFNDAADVETAAPLDADRLQAIFEAWVLKVREIVPERPPAALWKGAWQIFLDLEFATDKQLTALRDMDAIRARVLAGEKDLADFRTAFARWVTAGATYYQNGVSVMQTTEKLKAFQKRLIPHLEIDVE